MVKILGGSGPAAKNLPALVSRPKGKTCRLLRSLLVEPLILDPASVPNPGAEKMLGSSLSSSEGGELNLIASSPSWKEV